MRVIKRGRVRGRGVGVTSLPKGSVLSSVKWECFSAIRLAVVIRRHCFLGNANAKRLLQNVKEVKAQPSGAQLMIDRAKIGAQGGLALKSVLHTNCCIPPLGTMSPSLTLGLFRQHSDSHPELLRISTDPK